MCRSVAKIAFLTLFGLLVLPDVLAACPNCKDGLHDDGRAAWAFGVSIFLMMSMPLLIFTGWFVAFSRWRSMDQFASTDSVEHKLLINPLID